MKKNQHEKSYLYFICLTKDWYPVYITNSYKSTRQFNIYIWYTKQNESHQHDTFKKPDTIEYMLYESTYTKFEAGKIILFHTGDLQGEGGYVTRKGHEDASWVLVIHILFSDLDTV